MEGDQQRVVSAMTNQTSGDGPELSALFGMASAEESHNAKVMPGNLPHPVDHQHGDVKVQPAHPSSGQL